MADKKITLKVLSQAGAEVSTVSVSGYVFGQKEATQAVHDAIVVYQANMRQDTAKTKKRDEVSGGGKKPWRQKGTGTEQEPPQKFQQIMRNFLWRQSYPIGLWSRHTTQKALATECLAYCVKNALGIAQRTFSVVNDQRIDKCFQTPSIDMPQQVMQVKYVFCAR